MRPASRACGLCSRSRLPSDPGNGTAPAPAAQAPTGSRCRMTQCRGEASQAANLPAGASHASPKMRQHLREWFLTVCPKRLRGFPSFPSGGNPFGAKRLRGEAASGAKSFRGMQQGGRCSGSRGPELRCALHGQPLPGSSWPLARSGRSCCTSLPASPWTASIAPHRWRSRPAREGRSSRCREG